MTFAYLGNVSDIAEIIASYEEETGVIVKAVNYSCESVEEFCTKMMADDNDFDCFYTRSLPYIFPISGKYVDL